MAFTLQDCPVIQPRAGGRQGSVKQMPLNLQYDYEVSLKLSALQGMKAQPQQSHFVVEC